MIIDVVHETEVRVKVEAGTEALSNRMQIPICAEIEDIICFKESFTRQPGVKCLFFKETCSS